MYPTRRFGAEPIVTFVTMFERSPLRRGLKGLLTNFVIPAADVLLLPITLVAALWLKLIRRVGVYRMRSSRALFNRVGLFPIRDHYYEPAFSPRHLRRPLSDERHLPGIDMDVEGQLAMLSRFAYAEELDQLPRHSGDPASFYYDNPNFPPGDSEYLYSVVRLFKPQRIVEVGSGFSTLMILKAVAANIRDDASYRCAVRCIEPYEMRWLGQLAGVQLIRQRVEDVDASFMRDLEPRDILFIDSSHVIRPQGDVLKIVLEFLPVLRPGVLVQVHDIFTPRDYPAPWLIDQVRLWNEQYLLEAFLSCNPRFRVVGALNFLAREFPDHMAAKFPAFREKAGRCDPGSLWLQSQ